LQVPGLVEEPDAPGSSLEYTRGYRAFVEQFCIEHGIRSVVDAGCGDWSFSHAISWKGVSYLGLDIVPELVARNRACFPGVEFEVADVRDLGPYAGRDLLLVKDVLQHWSGDTVRAFLRQPALASFKHVLLTNCDTRNGARPELDGEFRPLGLESPELEGFPLTTAFEFGTKSVLHRGPRLTASDVLGRFECWIINLEHRPDRLAHTRRMLRRIGLAHAHRLQAFDGEKLELVSARPKPVRRGAIGCYLSHLALLKQAQARRVPCIIVEDDLDLASDFELELGAFFEVVPEDWDVVLLPGRDHVREPTLLGPHHARLVATWGTAFTILRLPAIDRLLEDADALDRPIDDYYISHMPSLKFYSAARRIVSQADALGSNIWNTQ
jgi:GR25 family glycosyltransferase involved in LPS biosynthesis